MGFFDGYVFSSAPKATATSLPKCGTCGLYKHCQSPKMPVWGGGKRGILLVSESPGKNEDETGRQLTGESGQLLKDTLRELGVDIKQDCWLTYALICHAKEVVKPYHVESCRPNLLRIIREKDPHTIVLMGSNACKSLLGHLEYEDGGSVMQWAGWAIPSIDLNRWICPVWSPALVLREERNPSFLTWWKQHLKQAVGFTRKPHEVVPDYKSRVNITFDDQRAKRFIERLIYDGQPVAFDYETNMLKPDGTNSEIICCALSNGVHTVAFPWLGKVIPAMKRFLRSPVPKIGANIKFEHRWTKAILGVDIQNWVWDVVQAAHILDNREGVTGVKFQASALLGISPYDLGVKQYLDADNSRAENRIKECDTIPLLEYCGLDALVEYKIAEIQSRQLGIKLWNL